MLNKNSRPTIALLMNSFYASYDYQIWLIISDKARELNINLITFTGGGLNSPFYNHIYKNSIYDLIDKKNINGIISSSSAIGNFISHNQLEDYFEKYSGIPFVSIGIKIKDKTSILVDNEKGMYEGIIHLIEKHNCKNIAFIKGLEYNPEANSRFNAYINALKRYNIPFKEELVVQGDFFRRSGTEAVKILLDQRKIVFDAIVGSNDLMAFYAMKELQKRGYKIPEDIAVVGFDDAKEGQLIKPSLTTIKQPYQEIGQKSVDSLLSLINGDKTEDIILTPKLIIRSSCGCNTSIYHEENIILDFYKNSDKNNLINNLIKSLDKIFPEIKERINNKEWLNQIVNEIFKKIENNEKIKFINAIEKIITESLDSGIDIFILYKITSYIFSFIINYYNDDLSKINIIYDTWKIIFTIIGIMGEKHKSMLIGIGEENYNILFTINREILGTFDINQIKEILINELPNLNIKSCYICLYNDKGLKQAKVLFQYNADKNIKEFSTEPFSSNLLVPGGLKNVKDKFGYLLFPLVFKNENLGFILFEDSSINSTIYEIFSNQLSGIIKSTILIEESQSYSESLEIKVNERTLKLEEALKKIEETNIKLQKLDSLKNDFIANVSHELKTPLTLIIGPLEAILSKEYGDIFRYDDVRLKSMHYNGLKLLKLINNLLDFSIIDAGKIRVEMKKLKISKLLKFFVTTVKSGIENLGLDITYIDNIGPKFIVYTDKNILEKSVFNLISNSLKFTPKGGQITVQLEKRDNFYDISVKDTGIGIPDDKIDKIFERFHQLDNQISRKYEGTGIGLALTKELIESLGGKISVKSKLNEGSTFTITLPYEIINDNDSEIMENNFEINPYLLSDFENNEELVEDTCNKYEHGKKKILIVEDNRDMQKYIKSILCEKYIVNIAKNGKEGLEKVFSDKPDLILADVMMPELDGYQMTEIIKSRDDLKGIPVLLLTAKTEMCMKIKGFKKGADDYIIKPFNNVELLARINAHLEIKRLRDEVIKQKEDLEIALNEKIIAQRQLETSERRFRDMAENLPVAIIENNPDNNILYLNKYAKQLLNISIKDNLLDFIEPAINGKFINKIEKLQKTGNIELCECKLKSRDGNNITALIKSIMIYDQDKPKCIRSTIMEIEPNYNILLMPCKEFCMKYNITERETEIIILLIKGLSYSQIGEKLFISYKTVDNHISNIYRKTNVNNRNQLVELIQKN